MTGVATNVGPGEPERFANEVDQEHSWLNIDGMFNAVHLHFNWNFGHR